MRKPFHILVFFLCVLLAMASPVNMLAAEYYPNMTPVSQNETTGYVIYMDDWADLLTDTEEQNLLEIMKPITQYGNVAFVTITENPTYSTESYAEQYYYDHFTSNGNGTLLLIDMQERYLWIYSNGDIYDTVNTAYANSITDNIYTYASEGDYYTCASKAFEQIHILLEGRPIAQPMKYISNALLAVAIALLINYFVVITMSRSKKASTRQLMDGIYTKVEIHNPTSRFVHQTRTYSPRSSGSGGKGGRSGGGGGSRGGGGGHRF